MHLFILDIASQTIEKCLNQSQNPTEDFDFILLHKVASKLKAKLINLD